MLHEFISSHRDEIIRRCRAKVATRSIPPPTTAEIDHGVPMFLDQLIAALRLGRSSDPEIDRSALLHGHDLLLQGFTVSQVVHDYGDVCQAITELAAETGATIAIEDFRTLSACLEAAVAGAVAEYGRERHESDVEGEAARGTERLGLLAHELRNVLHTATLAFEILKSGNVGITGNTGALLHRSLIGLDALIGRSLAEVRLSQGIQHRERFLVSPFITDVAAAAVLEGDAKGVRLNVPPIDGGMAVEADRQVLAAVAMNVLQNAFTFTQPHSTVTLGVSASDERVLIEVRDESVDLAGKNIDDLFRSFEQRAAGRSDAGLGLAFCRWAMEANGGRIYARSVHDAGCAVVLDLPRVSPHDLAGAS
jgi:signal transduction histidine kinase